MPELMYDQFKIASKKMINNDDILSLTKLYLPLMGIDSYSLYLGLSTFNFNTLYNYKNLLDTLNFKSIKAINTASSKLEALGLLKVYKNNKNDYLYELIRPYSINEFLKEEMLKTLLISQIGESEVKKIEKENLVSYSGFKNITKNFEDVFDIKTDKTLDVLHSILPHEFEIKNDNFNYSLFKMLFDTGFINEDVLEESDFKSSILRISFIYKLNEEQMRDVVISSLDIDKSLDYACLSKNARREFRKTNINGEPQIITKEKDDYLSSIKDDKILALCNWLESVSPTEVLEEISGIKPSIAEIKLFEDLVNNTKFPISVINMMILVVNEEKQGELPSYNYFEKIANTWARAKVKNVMDVIKYIEKKNDKTEITKKTYYKKEERLPEWYQTYNKELDKKLSDNNELDQEQVKEILDQAKDLFGE